MLVGHMGDKYLIGKWAPTSTYINQLYTLKVLEAQLYVALIKPSPIVYLTSYPNHKRE